MALHTHIEGLSTLELLRVISNSRLSGVLTIVDRLQSGRIVFTWGRVTHAATDEQVRIGDLLVTRGEISERDLEAALRAQRGHRKARPLGTILCSMGFAETSQIQRALRDQMKEAFYRLLEWKNGVAHLQVDIGTALASVRLDVSLDTQALLLEAARRRDEKAGMERGESPPSKAGYDALPETTEITEPAVPIEFPQAAEASAFDELEVLKPSPSEAKRLDQKPSDNHEESTPPVTA